MNLARRKGIWAETFVLKNYLSRGFSLVERNVICGFGEIDLVLKLNKMLVFVEVRLLESCKFMHPVESVDYRKLKVLRRTCDFYYTYHWQKDTDYTLEVATVSGSIARPRIEIWPDALEG